MGNYTLETPEGATREVVAQWVGDNLFKEGFAQALASGDASVGNAFLQALDKIRLALGGTKNSRTAGNIAMVERLFMRALENKNGVIESGGTTVYFMPKDENQTSIKQQLREHLDEINAMDPVADITYQYVDKATAQKEAIEEFKKYGYKVEKQGFGTVLIGEDEINKSINYIGTPAECAALMTVPRVIKRGKIVSDHSDHKGRAYGTITIAAPVTINGTTGIVGIVVRQTGKNRYHTHRILMPDGSAFVYSETIKAEPTTADMPTQNGDQGTAIGSASDTRVSQNSFGVNSYDMQNGGENSQFSFGGVNGTDINVPYEGDAVTESPSRGQAAPALAGQPPLWASPISPNRGVPFRQGGLDGREAANSQAIGEYSLARSPSSFADAKHRGNLETASGGNNSTFPYISMVDFANSESGVWRNIDYNDETTKSAIMRETHQKMVDEGAVVVVNDAVLKRVDESFPDLRSMKKKERMPILREAMSNLKTNIRQFLNGFKNYSFEFEVNGNILDAKLYNTGINEVVEKVTKEKAGMLYASDEIFTNARYLYSTPDYDGDPNVYRWNYFYTPVQIGEKVVGVRIAVRDMVQGTDVHTPESQIYNWGIKKDASLDGGSYGPKVASSDVSSDASAYSIRNPEENVKGNSSTGFAEVEVQGQEIPEGTTGATETVYREERITPDTVRREAAAQAGTVIKEKTVAQGRTLEELEQELSDRELFNRMYMAEQIDRPDSTVELEGRQVSSDAYMDAVRDK